MSTPNQPLLPCLLINPQEDKPWQRSRHHVLAKPLTMLQAVAGAGASGAATFAFSPAASQLACLWDHQLCGKAFLPLGALLEVAAAAAAAALGDAELLPRQQQLLLGGAAVPALVELPEEMAAPPFVLCTLSTCSGQLIAASSSAAGQRLCFSAQLGGAASGAVAPAADEPVTSIAKVRLEVLAWHGMHCCNVAGSSTLGSSAGR